MWEKNLCVDLQTGKQNKKQKQTNKKKTGGKPYKTTWRLVSTGSNWQNEHLGLWRGLSPVLAAKA